MNNQELQKPTAEQWLKIAQVVIDRLSTCVHVYSKPPYEDVFIPEKERQAKNAKTLDLLHRVHKLTDESETPTDSVAEAHQHDEKVIAGLAMLLSETLSLLPELSTDMQKLLKSPWHDHCNGRLANELFRGQQSESEGIGTGHPEHGRLPEALANLLEKEKLGDNRHPREELLRHGEPRRHDDEGRRRWAESNSRFLRTAGRIE